MYSNSPAPAIGVQIIPEVYPYYLATMILFALWFFISLHYFMHTRQHGFPPFYILRLKQVWDGLWR